MRYFVWLFLVILVVFRFFITRPTYPNGQKIRITDKVSTEPIRYPTTQRIILAGLKIYLPTFPEIYYGDKIVVEGRVDGDKLIDAELISLSESRGILFKVRKKTINVFQKSLKNGLSEFELKKEINRLKYNYKDPLEPSEVKKIKEKLSKSL